MSLTWITTKYFDRADIQFGIKKQDVADTPRKSGQIT